MCTSKIHSKHKTRSPAISMTSLMQFFGNSLNKIAKLRLHEKENSMRRNALDLVVSAFKASLLLSDETETVNNKQE